MISDRQLEQIAKAADRAALGHYTITATAEDGLDFWAVEFAGGRKAVGFPTPGRTGLDNLLVDIHTLGAVYKAARVDLPGLRAIFARWREEDQRRASRR